MSKRKPKPRTTKLPQNYRKGVLTSINRQTTLGRRLSSTFASIIEDVGGLDNMTVGQLMMAERLAYMNTMLQDMECDIVKNPEQAEKLRGRWIQCVNAQAGLIKSLGLDRPRNEATNVIDALYSEEAT